jgi:hypothetical protein
MGSLARSRWARSSPLAPRVPRVPTLGVPTVPTLAVSWVLAPVPSPGVPGLPGLPGVLQRWSQEQPAGSRPAGRCPVAASEVLEAPASPSG